MVCRTKQMVYSMISCHFALIFQDVLFGLQGIKEVDFSEKPYVTDAVLWAWNMDTVSILSLISSVSDIQEFVS